MSGPRNIDELHERASRPTSAVLSSLRSVRGRVLVIGAGGKMGFHLSQMLHRGLVEIGSAGRVIAVSRFASDGSIKLFEQNGIETIAADLNQTGAIERLPESSNIFYLAGVKFGTADNAELLQQTNVQLASDIAGRYSDGRIVALSTGCVYPFSNHLGGGSAETDQVDPPGDYAASCAGRENAFAHSGARTSLIRLNYSVDLRYGVLVDLAQKVIRSQPVDLTTGYVNVIWQGDANAFIVQSLCHAASPPFVVNVTGIKILRVRDIANRFGELFGQPVAFTGVESETAWLSNAEKAHMLWGPPAIAEDELIEWVAAWTLAGGETLDKPTRFEIRDGKY